MVGHDLGGFYACLLATQYPKLVEKLILMNTTHPLLFLGDSLTPPLPLHLASGPSRVRAEAAPAAGGISAQGLPAPQRLGLPPSLRP